MSDEVFGLDEINNRKPKLDPNFFSASRKETLEKEAENYAREWLYYVKDLELHHKKDDKPEYIRIKEAHLAGAESREKRINELEATNKKISDECHKLVDSLEKKQNEITELRGALELYESSACRATNLDKCGVVKELKAQIEKMKNWCNCKNYWYCLMELAEQGKGMKPSECCINCKKWELE